MGIDVDYALVPGLILMNRRLCYNVYRTPPMNDPYELRSFYIPRNTVFLVVSVLSPAPAHEQSGERQHVRLGRSGSIVVRDYRNLLVVCGKGLGWISVSVDLSDFGLERIM